MYCWQIACKHEAVMRGQGQLDPGLQNSIQPISIKYRSFY